MNDPEAKPDRHVNLMWETTQKAIALIVVTATIAVASFKALYDTYFDVGRGVAAGPAFIFLVGAANLVIGFYFGKRQRSEASESPPA